MLFISLSLLFLFEILADVFAKQWSLSGRLSWAAGALLAYIIGNSFWLIFLRSGIGIAKGGIIFFVGSTVLIVLLGIVFYHEALTHLQIIGVVLGVISLLLIIS